MGSFVGHLFPGLAFIFYGLVTLLHASHHFHRGQRNKGRRLGKRSLGRTRIPPWCGISSPCCYFPLEPLTKVLLPLGGIIGEIAHAKFSLYSGSRLINVNNFGHSAMFTPFVISGVIDLIGCVVHLPARSQKLFVAFAFALEFLAFALHLDGRSRLETQCHVLLSIACAACFMFAALESCDPSNVCYFIGRGLFTVVQGTWFIQLGLILYGWPPWDDNEHGILELASVAFLWHVIVNVLLMCLLFFLTWLTMGTCIQSTSCCVAPPEDRADVLNEKVQPKNDHEFEMVSPGDEEEMTV
ncbi:transmembrane protein 45B-like [Corticium candelabrum]|uniref:transmembrane protein 45B-like n=1 Tax=Corticium candelabrum TaxID=121492 RepID=UPI002E26BEEB|nr:transmembrane protein 45B-like [Corticium candelabrum]XP_062522655.1 transmembrane protein 45B-like [Corticium candelabrum]